MPVTEHTDPRPAEILAELTSLAHPEDAVHLSRFFKTGPGEYGEGDRFRGIRVPVLRKAAKRYRRASRETLTALLDSEFHEDRMLAILIMLEQFARANSEIRRDVYDLYMERIDSINNWDLVDVSAPHIVGPMLYDGLEPQSLLNSLAVSESMWHRRIAVLATFHFIKNNEVDVFLRLAERLVHDPHDLMHKACGWMLRETAKRDRAVVEEFLDQHLDYMPRVMLRYAIEHFPEERRQEFLKGKR